MLTWILTAAAPSDQDFLTQLYLDHERLMFSTAANYTADPEDQKDIVQSALVRLIQNAATLRNLNEYARTAYVLVAVRNMAIDFLRRRERDAACRTDDGVDPDQLAAEESMEELLARKAMGHALHQALKQLSETDQRLLTGKYLLGETDQALGAALGCSPGSVRMKLTRAKRRAVALMKKGGAFDAASK